MRNYFNICSILEEASTPSKFLRSPETKKTLKKIAKKITKKAIHKSGDYLSDKDKEFYLKRQKEKEEKKREKS